MIQKHLSSTLESQLKGEKGQIVSTRPLSFTLTMRFNGGIMMKSRNIFERDRAGEEITHQDEGYYKIRERIDEVQKILFELNGNYHTDEEIRNLFSQLTGFWSPF